MQPLRDFTANLAPPQMAKNEHRFSQDELRKMFYYGDTEEKAWLSLAVSYGQGSAEFLRLECEHLQNVIKEAKDKGWKFGKWLGEPRGKTSVQPVSFLTPECMDSLEAYFELLMSKHGKLPKYVMANSKLDKHITNTGLNKKLRRLVQKANIKTYNKRIHFHLIRKFTFSRLRRIDRDIAKVICAKQVSDSDMTYEEIESQCEKVFTLAYKNISLNGDVTGETKRQQSEKIDKLEQAITEQQKQLATQQTINETLTKKLAELDDKVGITISVLSKYNNTKVTDETTDPDLKRLFEYFNERFEKLQQKLKKVDAQALADIETHEKKKAKNDKQQKD